jgi:hypothetical protein
MKRLLISGIITATIIVFAGVIFYACKKDNGDKVTKNFENPTGLENPMEQYGIWHNECIKYMASQGAVSLTMDELWQTYGVGYFQEIVPPSEMSVENYVPVPMNALHAIYEYSDNIFTTQNYLSLLENLVNAGRVNPGLNIQDLIGNTTGSGRRNNYNILLDYFTFLTNHYVTSETTYWTAYNKLCEIEQEILTNYYDLLVTGFISSNSNICEEYEGVLFEMAIVRNSTLLWAPPSGSATECYSVAYSSGMIDFLASCGVITFHGPSYLKYGYGSDAAFCSAMAARGDVDIYMDCFPVTAW